MYTTSTYVINIIGISLSNGASALQRTVGSAKISAEHDNRTVYMEKVPADTTLVPVNAVSMVKPAALSEYINYNNGGGVFNGGIIHHGGGGGLNNGQGGLVSAAAIVFFKVPIL